MRAYMHYVTSKNYPIWGGRGRSTRDFLLGDPVICYLLTHCTSLPASPVFAPIKKHHATTSACRISIVRLARG